MLVSRSVFLLFRLLMWQNHSQRSQTKKKLFINLCKGNVKRSKWNPEKSLGKLKKMFVSVFYEVVSKILYWNKQFILNVSLSCDFLLRWKISFQIKPSKFWSKPSGSFSPDWLRAGFMYQQVGWFPSPPVRALVQMALTESSILFSALLIIINPDGLEPCTGWR